jgi:thiol-disulfide isomerase/thioredoxin
MSKLEYEITGGNNDLLAIATAHQHDIVLVDFYADWCGPCKKIAPMLHEYVAHFAKRKDGGARLILCKVNVDNADNDDLCTAYKVSAMPTLVWISKMKVMNRVEGANVDKITSITNELVQ